MICPKCGHSWIIKVFDGKRHHVCSSCGYVDTRNSTVDGLPIGPSSPNLGSEEHFAFEQQRKEIATLKALLREVCPDGIRRVSVDLDRRIRAALGESE